eukprot:UN28387
MMRGEPLSSKEREILSEVLEWKKLIKVKVKRTLRKLKQVRARCLAREKKGHRKYPRSIKDRKSEEEKQEHKDFLF